MPDTLAARAESDLVHGPLCPPGRSVGRQSPRHPGASEVVDAWPLPDLLA